MINTLELSVANGKVKCSIFKDLLVNKSILHRTGSWELHGVLYLNAIVYEAQRLNSNLFGKFISNSCILYLKPMYWKRSLARSSYFSL